MPDHALSFLVHVFYDPSAHVHATRIMVIDGCGNGVKTLRTFDNSVIYWMHANEKEHKDDLKRLEWYLKEEMRIRDKDNVYRMVRFRLAVESKWPKVMYYKRQDTLKG